MEQGLGEQVVELKNSSVEERATWRNQAIKSLVSTGETEKDASSLVDAVLETLGWSAKPAREVVKETVKQPVPKVVKTVQSEEPVKTETKEKTIKKPVEHNKDTGRNVATNQYIRFGPEEKIDYLNVHLPQIQGFSVYIIPNNRTNWRSLSKYTSGYPRGFQLICSGVEKLGINTSDMVLGIVTEESILKGKLKHALVFSDECIYQIDSDYTWKIKYREIARTEIQDNRIILWKHSGTREYVQPFHFEFNTRELHALIQVLVDGESKRKEIILPNTQNIEPPKKMFSSPYYAKVHGLRPGDSALCRTTPKALADNFVRECSYISQARKVKVYGGTGNMLYVEVGEDCHGWVFASVMRRE